MTEAEYEREFNEVRNDVLLAIHAFYTYLEIHKFASENGNYQKINQDAFFWENQLYGLQCTTFVAMGRAFDNTKGALSIERFLISVTKNRGLFSKNALADRKRKLSNNLSASQIDDYVANAWEPKAGDLEKLLEALIPAKHQYEDIYKDIRDKVFAHRQRNSVPSTLFEKTLIADIEDILFTVNDILNAASELFINGRKPEIGIRNRSFIDQTIREARTFLNRL